MKIIVPFDPDVLFSEDERAAISILQLHLADVIDTVLDLWLMYVYGSADEIYERTIDEIFDHIHLNIIDDLLKEKAEMLLSDQADLMANLYRSLAFNLRKCLNDIPHELGLSERDDSLYTFLRFCSFDPAGKFLILSTQTIPTDA